MINKTISSEDSIVNFYDDFIRKDILINESYYLKEYNKLLNVDTKTFVNIIKIEDSSIFMEKLNTDIVNTLLPFQYDLISKTGFNFNRLFDAGKLCFNNDKIIDFLNNKNTSKYANILHDIVNYFESMSVEAKKYKLVINDLHARQIGTDGNGNMKCFDWFFY